jgi:hypothetical protein
MAAQARRLHADRRGVPLSDLWPLLRKSPGEGWRLASAQPRVLARRVARQARDLEQHRAKLEQELEREVRDLLTARNRASPVPHRCMLADSMLRSTQSGRTAGAA